jgi:hypothetical protein
MKKEQAVLGFIAVAVIGFAAGRLTAPTGAGEEVAGATTESAKGAVASATDVALPVGTSPWKGGKDAKVTIIEFSDFQ